MGTRFVERVSGMDTLNDAIDIEKEERWQDDHNFL